ncbi:MAG: hypothetical protein ACE5GS_01285 [Kiloniellaceae bacterium]
MLDKKSYAGSPDNAVAARVRFRPPRGNRDRRLEVSENLRPHPQMPVIDGRFDDRSKRRVVAVDNLLLRIAGNGDNLSP